MATKLGIPVTNIPAIVTDATAGSGLDILDCTQAALFTDLDNDGDLDLPGSALRVRGKGRRDEIGRQHVGEEVAVLVDPCAQA